MKINDFSDEIWWFSKFALELTFDLFTSNVDAFPFQWWTMQILFNFQVNRMWTDNFSVENWGFLETMLKFGLCCVDLLAYFDLLVYVYLKIQRWLN